MVTLYTNMTNATSLTSSAFGGLAPHPQCGRHMWMVPSDPMVSDSLTYPLGHMYRVHAVGVGRDVELDMLLLDSGKQKIKFYRIVPWTKKGGMEGAC